MKYFSLVFIIFLNLACNDKSSENKPNIILIMTDDQGWGQTGYYNHPLLKTPNLDSMATNGLRLDRFYAGSPLCSPTRATVLTGRSNDRTGVFSHGYALRLQEKTLAEALKKKGYKTAHFGKWHLNGLKGPGVPILKDDDHSPESFGFDYWISTTNFFDLNPMMSQMGEFIDFKGSSSEIIVNESLKFIEKIHSSKSPFFIIIWDGSPHDPFLASEEDKKQFKSLDEESQNHYGELVAFDRSIGVLRKRIRDLGISENTLLWFCSDNGGLDSGISPSTVGGLKGFKSSMWEGGLRVPSIIEWPSMIKPKKTNYPASTMDIFPTIAEIVGLPESGMLKPIDGVSIVPVFNSKIKKRENKIPFRLEDKGALIDNNIKFVAHSIKSEKFELYDLKNDPKESIDISKTHPEIFEEMKKEYLVWNNSVDASLKGKDYLEGKVLSQPKTRFWMGDENYKIYLEEFILRPEYERRIRKFYK